MIDKDSPFHVPEKQHYEDHAWVKAFRDRMSAAGNTIGNMIVWGAVIGFLAFCTWIYKITGGQIK